MEFRKTIMTTLYSRQQKRHRCERQTTELRGRRRGWDDMREQHWNMNIIICIIDDQCKFNAWSRATQNRCSGTTQRDGVGREEGGGFRIEGVTCAPMADWCWCVAEATTVLWSNCLPIKINKFFKVKKQIFWWMDESTNDSLIYNP